MYSARMLNKDGGEKQKANSKQSSQEMVKMKK